MKRSSINFLVDAVAAAALILLAATGALIRFVLPPGTGHSLEIWGLDRHGWGSVHFWLAMAFAAAMVLHVVLHWSWAVCMIRGDTARSSKRRITLAWVIVLALLGLSLALLAGPVRETEERPHRGESAALPHRAESAIVAQSGSVSQEAVLDVEAAPEEHSITGSMTLSELEELSGVPAQHVLQELGLPSNVPLDERLGRLRRTYGFEMDDVREIVARYGGE